MIAIVATKENKNLVRLLTEFLEKAKFQVWNPWKNTTTSDIEQAIEKVWNDIKLLILPISQKDLFNTKILNIYRTASQKQIPIILYLTSDFDKNNLAVWFFLENNTWINGYDTSFKQASEALMKLVEEVYTKTDIEKPQEQVEDFLQSEKQISQTKDKKIYVLLIAIISILVATVAGYYFLYIPANTNNQPVVASKSMEDYLIGTWKLVDYKDDIQRTGAELQSFLREVARLKKNFEFTFNPDHTFIRKGFSPNPDIGTWQLDPIRKELYISPLNSQSKDVLRIVQLNDSIFVFEVSTFIKPDRLSIIRFTLKKAR